MQRAERIAAVRVVLLTTESTNHVYVARRLASAHALCAVVVQTRIVTPPFDVAHPYEERRDAFERDVLLDGDTVSLADLAETVSVPSVNDAVWRMQELEPDVVLALGTRRLRPPAIAVAGAACLRVHSGDPERYRGLDLHLWAVYHGDFPALVTTLHHVHPALDMGHGVGRAAVPLTRGMELHELRAAETRVCTELSLGALDMLERGEELPERPVTAIGRTYSAMPAPLKDVCVDRFRRYTSWL